MISIKKNKSERMKYVEKTRMIMFFFFLNKENNELHFDLVGSAYAWNFLVLTTYFRKINSALR